VALPVRDFTTDVKTVYKYNQEVSFIEETLSMKSTKKDEISQ
jgi:hypothetical protein